MIAFRHTLLLLIERSSRQEALPPLCPLSPSACSCGLDFDTFSMPKKHPSYVVQSLDNCTFNFMHVALHVWSCRTSSNWYPTMQVWYTELLEDSTCSRMLLYTTFSLLISSHLLQYRLCVCVHCAHVHGHFKIWRIRSRRGSSDPFLPSYSLVNRAPKYHAIHGPTYISVKEGCMPRVTHRTTLHQQHLE